MQNVITVLAIVAGLSLQSCKQKESGTAVPDASSGPPKLTIAVIPKGTTHVYWKSVEAGAEQAGVDLGVEIIWKGPLKENDRAQQIDIVEQFVGDKVSAIVLAPLDDSALVAPVREASAAKVPVVIIDSGLKADVGKDFASFVATDNHKGGEIAGTELARLLNGKGKVVLLRYMEGSASTAEREAGFLEVIKKNPGMEVISQDRFAGATASEAQIESMNMLDQIKSADGVFCPNESSVFGMLLALKQTGIAGKVKFVGFDATPQLTEALKAGEIDALVAQDPIKMGYQGVKQAVAAVKGQPVEQRVDTGVRLIRKEDLDDPAVKKMIGQ